MYLIRFRKNLNRPMKYLNIKLAIAVILHMLCCTLQAKDILLPDSLEFVRLSVGGDSLPENILLRKTPLGRPALISGRLGLEFNDSSVTGSFVLPFEVSHFEFESADPTLFYADARRLGFFDVTTGQAKELITVPDSIESIAPFEDGVYFSCGNKVFLSDFDSDSILCVTQTPEKISKVKNDGGDLYIATSNYIFGLTTEGNVIPVCRAKERIIDFELADNGDLYVVTPTRSCMVRPGNKILPILGESVRNILYLEGKLYVILNDGSLGMIRLR